MSQQTPDKKEREALMEAKRYCDWPELPPSQRITLLIAQEFVRLAAPTSEKRTGEAVKSKKCACGADCVPGTGYCFVCNPKYPDDARREYFRNLPPEINDDDKIERGLGAVGGDLTP